MLMREVLQHAEQIAGILPVHLREQRLSSFTHP